MEKRINLNKNKVTVTIEELSVLAKLFPSMTVKELLELRNR